MLSRRKFLKSSLLVGMGMMLPAGVVIAARENPAPAPAPGAAHVRMRGHKPRKRAAIAGGTLDPAAINKYAAPLVIPPAMPKMQVIKEKGGVADYYEISVRQFQQQILPPGLPATTVWGYGSAGHSGTHNYPSFTIEAKTNRKTRVKWINDLKDAGGGYLPHLLAVDPTLHWANPPGGMEGRDSRPSFAATPGRYTGPVPFVTHVHGANADQESDGYAEAWYLPDANNIPAGYATTGTLYDYFQQNTLAGAAWTPGSATFTYPNTQNASTLWYHDHTLGMTRLNVYAGPAGFYLLRGGATDEVIGLPGPAPKENDKPGKKYYEIPLAIQDRSFNSDGSLFFPDTRAFFDGIAGPYMPESDISPMWNPEFFGNTMVVNGRTWPKLTVEPRRYRFRMLNGCNSRFLILKLVSDVDPLTGNPLQSAPAVLPFWQIGAEGGFLPEPAMQKELLLGPAERPDVIVDFTGLPVGTRVYMVNLAPDEPFGGGVPGVDFAMADAASTGQVMLFEVGPLLGVDASLPPNQLVLPAVAGVPAPAITRQVSLNEMMSMYPGFDGPAAAMLGVMDAGSPMHLMWDDPISEQPALGAAEVWEIFNFTADAHPIHIHEVMFQVVDREGLATIQMDGETMIQLPAALLGNPRPPEPGETGYKDTVIAYPGEVTRVKMVFNRPGLYVWHCHIVDHEDNEMMRPFHVGPIPPNLPV